MDDCVVNSFGLLYKVAMNIHLQLFMGVYRLFCGVII